MRPEKKIDFELFLAADEKLHLVVRHDRHRHVGDAHLPEVELLEDAEVHRNRLAQQAGESSFEISEQMHRKRAREALGDDRQHRSGINDPRDGFATVDHDVDSGDIGAADSHRQALARGAAESINVDVCERLEVRHVPRFHIDAMVGREFCPVEAGLEVVRHVFELREVPGDRGVNGAERLQIDCRAQVPSRIVVAAGGKFCLTK